MNLNYLWIGLTALSILSQIPHAYWGINNFSRLETKWARVGQNVVFCSIISLGILGFALDGLHLYAAGGVIVEIVINLYYYDKIWGATKLRSKLEKYWLAYFLAFLIPISIYIFSSLIIIS